MLRSVEEGKGMWGGGGKCEEGRGECEEGGRGSGQGLVRGGTGLMGLIGFF